MTTLDDAAERRCTEAAIALLAKRQWDTAFIDAMRLLWWEATEAAAKKCDEAANNHHGLGSAESACLYCADSIRGKP